MTPKEEKEKNEMGEGKDTRSLSHLQSLPLEGEGLATMAACLFFCISIIRSINQLRAQTPAAWRTEPRFFFFPSSSCCKMSKLRKEHKEHTHSCLPCSWKFEEWVAATVLRAKIDCTLLEVASLR